MNIMTDTGYSFPVTSSETKAIIDLASKSDSCKKLTLVNNTVGLIEHNWVWSLAQDSYLGNYIECDFDEYMQRELVDFCLDKNVAPLYIIQAFKDSPKLKEFMLRYEYDVMFKYIRDLMPMIEAGIEHTEVCQIAFNRSGTSIGTIDIDDVIFECYQLNPSNA